MLAGSDTLRRRCYHLIAKSWLLQHYQQCAIGKQQQASHVHHWETVMAAACWQFGAHLEGMVASSAFASLHSQITAT